MNNLDYNRWAPLSASLTRDFLLGVTNGSYLAQQVFGNSHADASVG